jgi:hypothetical protein
MKLIKLFGLSFVAIVSVTTAARLSATMLNETPVAYFLEQRPADINALENLPRNAKEVISAKVRVEQDSGVAWLGGRHCEGCTNDILGARIKIVEVLTGDAQVGQIFYVLLGQRSEKRAYIAYPITPDQLGRQYIVVIYLGGDGKRRLVPFEMSSFEYDKWNTETRAYKDQRLRGKPGSSE